MERLRHFRNFRLGRPVETAPSKSSAKKTAEKKPVVKSKATAEKKTTSRKFDVKGFGKTMVYAAGTGVLAATLFLALKGNIFDNNGSDDSSTTTSSQPLAGANDETSTTTTIADTTTTSTILDTTTTTEGQPEGFQISPEAQAFLDSWPTTPEEAAQKFGGDASQWMRNPEWPDSRTIDNPTLGITNFINREWIPTDFENLPFEWPQTPEEAAEYFFPGQNVDPRFIQPAWIDPETGDVVGWHRSEDEWIVDGNAEVSLFIHTGETAEGYTVNGTLDPADDRNWVAFGGFANQNTEGVSISLREGQGWTVWMPGRANPDALATRMELFVGDDTPFYRGENGEQLGPIAINFPPAYPAPKNS